MAAARAVVVVAALLLVGRVSPLVATAVAWTAAAPRGGGAADVDLPPSLQALRELPTGWAATMVCSGVFVAGISAETVIAEDCDLGCVLANVTIDYSERSVTAVLSGSGGEMRKSIWRGDASGCTLVDGITEAELRAQDIGDQSPLPPLNASAPWPLGDLVNPEGSRDADVDWAAVEAAVDADFACANCNVRSIAIVHRGRIVLERYAASITEHTRLMGWSCTKTITNALAGILVGEGRLNVDAPAPVPEWAAEPGDPRATVTLNNVLQMTSGQLWREAPGDVRCLFTAGDGDCAGWYARQPQEAAPGTFFVYSTGSAFLLMRIVLQQRGDPQWTNFDWPRHKLFRRLGMASAVVEAQANTFLGGGSLGYMTARDWARFGLLYLRDGVWADGDRVLPEGWVTYTSTPTAESVGTYGANVWVRDEPLPHFSMDGFRKQYVWVFPSKDLVVVRMAMPALVAAGGDFDPVTFLQPITAAFPDAS